MLAVSASPIKKALKQHSLIENVKEFFKQGIENVKKLFEKITTKLKELFTKKKEKSTPKLKTPPTPPVGSPVTPPRSSNQKDLEKKGIVIIDRGTDYIAGTSMTLKIKGQEYTMSYSGRGINSDTLVHKNGDEVSKDIRKLVEDNREQILDVAINPN